MGIDIIAPHLNPPSDPYTSEYYAGTALGMKVESGGQSAYVQEMAGVMFCWLGPQDFITCPMQSGVKPLPDSISIHGLPEWADGTVKFTPAIRVSRNVINNKHPNEPQRFDEHWEEGPTITINVIP